MSSRAQLDSQLDSPATASRLPLHGCDSKGLGSRAQTRKKRSCIASAPQPYKETARPSIQGRETRCYYYYYYSYSYSYSYSYYYYYYDDYYYYDYDYYYYYYYDYDDDDYYYHYLYYDDYNDDDA